MITKVLERNFDKVLVALLESNDQIISGGRAKMEVKTSNNKMKITVFAKDSAAARAMNKSVENTIKVLDKVRSAL